MTLDARATSLVKVMTVNNCEASSAHLVLAHCVLGCELAVVKVHARHGGGHQAQDEDHRGHLGGGCHCVKSLS